MQIHFEEPFERRSEDVVETTSAAAAKAMARYYMGQEQSGLPSEDEEELLHNNPYITSREEDGRTVYSIRPLPRAHASEGRHAHSTERRPLTLFHNSLKKKSSRDKSLRPARSNPQLRSTAQPRHLFPDDRGYYRPTASAEELTDAKDSLQFLTLPSRQFQHHILTPSPHSSTPASALNFGSRRSRSSSVPKLSETSLDNLNARGVLTFDGSGPGSSHTADVLGHLLGWSDPPLHHQTSATTLSPSHKAQGMPLSSRLKHVSGVSYSSSAEAGDEASQRGSGYFDQWDSQATAALPSDLQEELVDERSASASPSQSPGPSTPTLTTANYRPLNHFPSNESNTIRFDSATLAAPMHSSPKQIKASSPPRSPEINKDTQSDAWPTPKVQASPFGQGVKLKSKTLKRMKPLQPSESMSAFENSLADLTQEIKEEPRSRFQDPVIFDMFQTFEQHSDIFRYEAPSAASRDSLAGLPAHTKGSWSRHVRTGSTSSLLSTSSETSSVKLNAQQITVSAAPADDPRFVIWGERPSSATTAPGEMSGETSSPPLQQSSGSSRRWSRKASISSHDLANMKSSVQHRQSGPPQKVLMAATVERWVAELTSKIDPELLADFFLSFRFFLSPISLCQLLITRFNWALAAPDSPEDEAARRIVRVRSFVVIRHWLLNYFVEDFVPDAHLRSVLTGWLNTTAKLPQVKASPSDQRLIKNLKKVVRRLKDQYASIGTALEHGAAQLSAALTIGQLHERYSRPNSPLRGPAIVLDEDVDLNLNTYSNATGLSHHRNSASGGHRGTEGMLLPVSPPKDRRLSMGYTHEPTHERQHNGKLVKEQPGSSPTRAPHGSSPVVPVLPLSHSPVSRAVTSTLGQFGRFKRMLQNRAGHTPSSEGATPYAYDHYEADVFSTPASSSDSRFEPSFETSASPSPTSSSGLDTPSDDAQMAYDSPDTSGDAASSGLGIVIPDEHEDQPLRHTFSSQTIKSQNRTSREKPASFGMKPSHPERTIKTEYTLAAADVSQDYRASVVQLDDVGLSDDSDADEVELPRTLRRLPAARDLRQAETLRRLAPQASRTTVSSFATNKSSRLFHKASLASSRSRSSRQSGSSDDEAAQGVITNFVVEGLDDSDDEEPGDVEAALRRLEGQIDDGKQKEKADRVERQMAKSKAAVPSTGGLDAPPESDQEESEAEARPQSIRSSTSSNRRSRSDVASAHIQVDQASEGPAPRRMSLSTPETSERPSSRLSLAPSHDRAPKSRLSTIRKSMARKPSIRNLLGRAQSQGPELSHSPSRAPKISIPAAVPSPYRSFVLLCKTEVLARQFCLIERDLLSNISWHELIHGVWRRRDTQLDVLDWEQYIKSRARRLVEARDQGRQLDSTEIYAAIARFNLVANWVASEIVMTHHLEERAALVGKFIRLAWKSYRQSNFQTLTQIIHGLQSIYVERLHKTWARVGMWEMRVFRDLKVFTSHARNFRSLRNVTDSLAQEWGPPGQTSPIVGTDASAPSSHRMSTSGTRHSQTSSNGCIPFLGLFLRDLSISNELPTFLDATSPITPASVDADTHQLTTVADSQAFSDLPPIPPPYQLHPLVNVHKARTISTIVQKVLIFQEMAGCYPFEAEPALFKKCLALQCLPVEGQRAQSFKLEA